MNNSKIAFSGVMTALAIVLTLLMNVFTFNTMFILVILSLIISVIMQKNGTLWAVMSFIATGFVMLFVTTMYDAVLEYFAIFGSYPIVKYLIETKVKRRLTDRLLKLGYTGVMSVLFTLAVVFIIGGEAYLGELYNSTPLMPYLLAVAVVIFWNAYDYVLTYVIYFYNKRFSKNREGRR